MAEGCDLCRLFSGSLHSDIEKALAIFRRTDVWIHLKISEAAPTVSERSRGLGYSAMTAYIAPFPMRGLDFKCIESRAEFCLVADEGSEAAQNCDIIGQYLDVSDALAHAYISTIKNWVQNCRDEHQICRMNASTDTTLPMRCIRIFDDHLVLQQTENMKGPYVILSHRWNAATMLSRTLKSNYKQRQEGFQALLLSQVFQDAIEVTRKLDIPFIWIDSICIIQDGSDWEHEAVKMSQYYRNASVTLAAATSEGAKDASIFLPCQVPWKGNLVRLPYRDNQARRKGHFYIYERQTALEEDFRRQVLETELLTRGWVFQERVLSPRIVYFTKTGLFWECRDHVESGSRETLGGRFVPEIQGVREENESEGGGSENISATKLVNEEEIFKNWYRIIGAYSASELTLPEKDRMVAITGVANEYKMRLEREFASTNLGASGQQATCHYIWGLWLWDIHQGLLWIACDNNGNSSKCGAPSWSWGSTCSTIKWLYERRDETVPECQILQLQNVRGDLYDVKAFTRNGSSPAKGIVANLFSRTPAERVAFTTNMPTTALDEDNADSSSRIAQIRIKGSMRSMIVSESQYFVNNDEQFDRVEALTGARSNETDRKHWRSLMDSDAPSIIIGWASLDLQESPANCPSGIFALHISTRKKPGGFKLGLLSWYREVYDAVLLVREDFQQEVPQYRRIGAACIFEMGFFRGVEPRLLSLA